MSHQICSPYQMAALCGGAMAHAVLWSGVIGGGRRGGVDNLRQCVATFGVHNGAKLCFVSGVRSWSQSSIRLFR